MVAFIIRVTSLKTVRYSYVLGNKYVRSLGEKLPASANPWRDAAFTPTINNNKTPSSPHRRRRDSPHLGIVMHLVLIFWVVMAFSNSSSCPVFFSFFTRLLTAFSHHFSSWPFCSPFFQPKSLLTMGGVKGKIDISKFKF